MTDRNELEAERQRFRQQKVEMNRIHRENCNIIHQKMDELLGSLREKNGVLTFESLQRLPLLEKYSLDEKIDIIKVKETKKNIVFETYMEPNSSFSMHSHDCWEVVEVLEGHYIDDKKRKDPFLVGDKIIYGKMEKHQPRAEIKSKYIVSFIK